MRLEVTEFADGAVASGNGLGSMKVGCWYRDWVSGDVNPTINFSGTPQAAYCMQLWQKGAGETWDTPTFVTAAWPVTATTQTISASSTVAVPNNSVVMCLIGLRDDSAAFTRAATTGIDVASGITWNGNYVESPATHGTFTGGFDCAADLGHRFVTTGGTVTLRATATISAVETGAMLWVVQSVTVAPTDWPDFVAAGSVLASATSSTANIPVPAGVQNESVVLCFIRHVSATITVNSLPSGFTEAPGSPAVAGGAVTTSWNVFWKRATGADSGTYDFGLSGSVSRSAIAVLYSGCITSGSPIDVDNIYEGTDFSTSLGPVAVTTTGDNELLVSAAAIWDLDRTFTPPTSFVEDVTAETNGFTINHLEKVSAGATGDLTGSISSATGGGRTVWLGALKPPGAAAVGFVPPVKRPNYGSLLQV
jgi:hypothetical protein